MIAQSRWRRPWGRLIATCLGLASWSAGFVQAQTPAPPAAPTAVAQQPVERLPAPPTPAREVVPPPPETPAPVPSAEIPYAAPSGGLLGGCASCGSGCGHGNCYPGQQPCSCCDSNSICGRFFCGIYNCICCKDPCYEPSWIPEANAAFFVDPVRPWTQTRIRTDNMLNYFTPDRSEFFWAAIGKNGRGPKNPEMSVNAYTASLYNEVAPTAKFSLFFEVPYTNVAPTNNPQASNFGDMNLGVKTLLCDCELIMVAFQFRTYLPVGPSKLGLGTGHVTLEPSLLASLKLAQQTYLQMQVAEWAPLGGDDGFMGSVLDYHFSLNHVLYRILPDVPIIGTYEFNGYHFQGGAYTDLLLGTAHPVGAGGSWFGSTGPGVRVSICKRIDFGLGTAFGLNHNGPQQFYRGELRFRF